MSPDIQRAAEAALARLRTLCETAMRECGWHEGDEAADQNGFSLVWAPEMEARDLAEEALRVAAECVSEQRDFVSGRVYCYACKSAACEHTTPPQPGEVFTGYQSTGRPEWGEFFNFLLQLDDPRTDLLFAARPEMLARVVGRHRLVADQLTSFGKNSLTYQVWGEVVAGYLHTQDIRAAMTVQIVETRDRRLHLQVLTDAQVREALANAPVTQRSASHRVHDALTEARRQTFSLSNVWQTTHSKEVRRQTRDKAFGILRHLAHSIEKKGRQLKRRTAHAEVRGQQDRPVHAAHEDLAATPAADFFQDAFRDSVIVLGKNGRAHVFSESGKHITSLTIKRDELERRQRRKRYLPLPDGAVSTFRGKAAAAFPSAESRSS